MKFATISCRLDMTGMPKTLTRQQGRYCISPKPYRLFLGILPDITVKRISEALNVIYSSLPIAQVARRNQVTKICGDLSSG